MHADQQFTLGFALVLCLRIGLAISLMSAGVIAAVSARHVEQRISGFGRHAPYVAGRRS